MAKKEAKMGLDEAHDPQKDKYAPLPSEKDAVKDPTKPQEANLATSEVKADETAVPPKEEQASVKTSTPDERIAELEKSVTALAGQVSTLMEAWDKLAQEPDEESADAGLKQSGEYAKEEPSPVNTPAKAVPEEPAKQESKPEDMVAYHSKELSQLHEEVKGLKSELAKFANSGIKKTAQSLSIRVVDSEEAEMENLFKKKNY